MTDRYAAAGVDYDVLDQAKRAALSRARGTSALLQARGASALDASRGEPAFVFTSGDRSVAFVLETLGTKSLIATRCEAMLGDSVWETVACDTVAAVVNDLICVGALPLVVNAYFATGSADWFQPGRLDALARGWARACEEAGATWGGGESPTLSGLIDAAEIELAGSAVGEVPSGCVPILGEDLGAGDEIVLVASAGLHANGASLIRKLADALPAGYEADIGDGTSLGAATLTPSAIYVRLVEGVMRNALPVSYLSHITGHGFRKIMRADADVTYVIDRIPPSQPLFDYVGDQLQMSAHERYGTFNMGAGFALYVKEGAGADVVSLAGDLGYDAWVAGRVEAGPRCVVIEPLQIEYGADELSLR